MSTPQQKYELPPHKHIIFYDGICGLCNQFLKFILKRDHHNQFIAIALQSEIAKPYLGKVPASISNTLNTVIIIKNVNTSQEKVLVYSNAALFCIQKCGGLYPLAILGFLIPKFIRDILYKLIANNRYALFGKYKTCPIPPDDIKKRVFF